MLPSPVSNLAGLCQPDTSSTTAAKLQALPRSHSRQGLAQRSAEATGAARSPFGTGYREPQVIVHVTGVSNCVAGVDRHGRPRRESDNVGPRGTGRSGLPATGIRVLCRGESGNGVDAGAGVALESAQ